MTNGQRLRDTFLHELIHAANWIIDKDHKAGHGPLFRKWGQLGRDRNYFVLMASWAKKYDPIQSKENAPRNTARLDKA